MTTWEGIASTFRSARKRVVIAMAEDHFSSGVDTKFIEAGQHAV